MRRWNTLDATPIPGTEIASYPAISPDGQEVAFSEPAGSGIRVVPLAGEVARTLVESTPERPIICCPRWSPDGAWIYLGLQYEGLWRVPSRGGAVEIVDSTAIGGPPFMGVLPDDNGLVYSQAGPGGLDIIRTIAGETGVVRDVTPGRYPRYTDTGHPVFQGDGGVLLAAPFDVRASTLTGPAVPVADGVAIRLGNQPSSWAVSRSGTLVYIPRVGESRDRLVLVDRVGREEPLDFEAEQFLFPRFSPDGGRLAVHQENGAGSDLRVFDLERGSRTRLTFWGGTPLRSLRSGRQRETA